MSLNDFEQTNALGREKFFVLPGGESETYAPLDTPPKQVLLKPLALTRLPQAMQHMGWHTAAALMQRWFDSPGWAMPADWKDNDTQPEPITLAAAQCDGSIVKMDWAMKFQRCREAIQIVETLVTTPAAVKLLKKRLRTAGWKGEDAFELGFYNMSAVQMDAICQLNFKNFGDEWDTLDDMYGALGSATLKIGAVGKAFRTSDPLTGRSKNFFHVEYIGFYIRDNYDFNGLQYLGSWTKDRVLTKSETILTTTAHGLVAVLATRGPFATVWNGDFRKYRNLKGLGGDFVLYSDVLWKRKDLIIELGDSA